MLLSGVKTRLFTVNLFADFILSHIANDEHTKIQITDTGKFHIINGYTTSKDKINLSKITEEFNELFGTIIHSPITNTIDILNYDSEPKPAKKIQITLHDTSNCVYSEEQLNLYNINKWKSYQHKGLIVYDYDDSNEPSISSFDPFGCSAKQYRGLLNYIKKIYYNLRTDCLVGSLTISVDLTKDEPDIDVYNLYYNKKDEKLKSAILDYFDFDLSKTIEITKNMDFLTESRFPYMDLNIFKKRLEDFYLF